MLNGDGTGEHLTGLIPAAVAYDTARNVTGDTRLDIIAHAIQQVEDQGYEATGVIMNSTDWSNLQLLKDGDGPFGSQAPAIWQRTVVPTPAMDPSEFLVGALQEAAQVFDRMETEALVSRKDRDNFVRRMLTVRAEHRFALAIKRPAAMVFGSFGVTLVA